MCDRNYHTMFSFVVTIGQFFVARTVYSVHFSFSHISSSSSLSCHSSLLYFSTVG